MGCGGSVFNVFANLATLGVYGAVKGAISGDFISGFMNAASGGLYSVFQEGMNLLTPKFDAAATQDYRKDREVMTNSATTPRRLVYGQTRVSGQIVYAQSSGSQNEYLHLVVVVAGHPIDSFGAESDIYLDNTKVADFGANVSYELYDGTQTAASSALIAASGGLWTADHKLLGCAYIYLQLKYDTTHFSSGIPVVRMVIKGRKVYDPRTSTTAWSDNPALCARDYMMLSGTYGGMGCSSGEVDDDAVIAAANICDQMVAASADGATEKRYTCNGAINIDSTPKAILEALLQSMCGNAVYSQGSWKVYAGAFSSSVTTMDETWLNGGISFNIGSAKNDRINIITGTYVNPGNEWASDGFDAVTDPVFLADDSGEELKKELALSFTTTPGMARRIAKILLRKSRMGTTLTYPTNLKGFGINAYDVVSVNNTILGWSGKTFRTVSWGFSATGGINLTLREESAWVYEWSSADFGTVASYIPPTLPDFTWLHQSVLANVTGLYSIYQGNQLWLIWPPVATFDPVRYEVRYGDTFGRAIILGETTDAQYPTIGDGMYWVSALTDYGRSAVPATLTVVNTTLTRNVVATFNEFDTGWTGTKTGAAEVDEAGRLWLGNIAGVVQTPGTYEIPSGHIVDLGTVQTCQCSVILAAICDSPTNLIDSAADFDAIADMDGEYSGMATVGVEIALSQDAITWGSWTSFVPGPYQARRYKFRLNLISHDPDVTVAVSGFTTIVDTPDRYQSWTGHSLSSAGETFTYTDPFHAAPNVQVTILNSSSGDYVVITSPSSTGFTLQVKNGSSGVGRTVNIIASGY